MSTVRVLSASGDGGWAVQTDAVRGVVEWEGARALPAVVVSVAGATRGGKSFLLGFFLRYLHATPEQRADGSWLGAPRDPLRGFAWRGGSDRDTTGILIWSEPIIMTQEINGVSRQVAVLLMDTQGTFDNDSTVRDCTTIFALSTLLSSVQVYNITQLIREDDLQHLQLFTEYGKLACSELATKPFQSLVFRVKDWMCPYQFPYGAAGGQQHLDKVLQITDSQKEELRELRHQIRANFESVSCVLTPHPGFAVMDENFDGQLQDLRDEFKTSLLEFVPSIFAPTNLKTKVVNGQEIKTEELLVYFRSYMEVFNSDDIPTPVSILKATSSACLEAAVEAARDAYTRSMSAALSRGVSGGAVLRAHSAARQVACDTLDARRTLAAPHTLTARRDHLMKELDDRLDHYKTLNEAKIQDTVVKSKTAYEDYIKDITGGRPLCLHPLDVEDVHCRAMEAAFSTYDENIATPDSDDIDNDRNKLQRDLQNKLSSMQMSNKLANDACVSEALAQYNASVQGVVRHGAVGGDVLQARHDAARTAAARHLAAARNAPSARRPDTDPHHTDLLAKIEDQFSYLKSSNTSNNRSAKRAALFVYHERMARVSGGACLHPAELTREHERARTRALTELRETRSAQDDDLEQSFLQELDRRYDELAEINVANNEALLEASYAEYSRFMESKCTPSLASILIVPWIIKVLVMLPKYHDQASDLAIDYFKSRRRGESDYTDDAFYSRLKDRIAAGYNAYCNPVFALAREFGVPLQ